MTEMRFITGGQFLMGSDAHYPEEGPAHQVRVNDFWIDETPVTNAAFKKFVDETGYVTMAERAPDPALYPGIQPEMMRAGSLLFTTPSGSVGTADLRHWWDFCFDADWRHPYGPDSSLQGLWDHPVVHIAYDDAAAFAAWAGKALPTEAEWEFAAKGGRNAQQYQWGDQLAPGGKMLANYWQGEFPWQNLALDGFERTSPVKSYPANDYGLYDMIGNVWEWTQDWFQERHPGKAASGCCIPSNPRGGDEQDSRDPSQPDIPVGRKVMKGGSHLCAENYCQRYRPAARYPQPIDTSTCHVGFRCARR
jgi:formylglycine-generating enzyme required for sulfatase activity